MQLAPERTGSAAQASKISRRLPRDLHPGAWWIWALGMATAASRTTNPLLLALILAVLAYVVSARRTEAPWAKGFTAYLWFGLLIVLSRLAFRLLLDGQYGEHVLFRLPELALPSIAAGVRIGGAVSLEGLLAALFDGLRLATLLICLGAANVLANPKRLLKSVPGALHEVGVALTVALTMAPQLVESAQRIRTARKLRGELGRRTHFFSEILVPVITDALDRSLLLAAAMDSRGYGRVAHVPARARRITATLVIAGLLGVCIGIYGLLDGTSPWTLGIPMLASGLVLAGIGFVMGGQRVQRSRYRPDPWKLAEWAVALSGVAVAGIMFVSAVSNPSGLNPSLQPLSWPRLPILPTLAILIGLLPAWVSPPPVRS